jgi:photosystem II stability/assembly factor-like uncharacterized protein
MHQGTGWMIRRSLLGLFTVACCVLLPAWTGLSGGAGAQVVEREVEGPAMSDATRPHRRSPSEESVPQSAPSIQALVVAKNHVVYAGSFGLGIFRSRDRGGSWDAVNAGLKDLFVLCLADGKDGILYAGTFRAGVFQSRDGGTTWQAMNTGLKRLEIKALLVEDDMIYAGTGDGVYRLSDADKSWRVVSPGLDETLVHTLARAPDGTLYAGTSGKGILRYRATFSAWTRLSHGLVDHEGLGQNFVRVLAVDKDQDLYAGTFDGGVFRSSDRGQTWQPISQALPNDSIRGIVLNEKGLFVATGRGIFKSQNKGRNWTPLNSGLEELSVQVLVASGEGPMYAGTSAGVFRSDDGGQTWIGVSRGLQGTIQSPFK